MPQRRLDAVLAERGLFSSRTAAAASVRAGEVRIGVDGPVAVKPSQLVEPEADLVVADRRRFVSRGGVKLQNALDALGIDPSGRDCLDVGSSTGGFVDCLLQRGAARVTALDVARGQLDWGLRNEPRVTVLEGLNARNLDRYALLYSPSLVTVDLAFISLAKVLPAVASVIDDGGELLALVKPQFELGRERVGKGGVVRAPEDRREALLGAARAAAASGLGVRGFASSGLPGPKGNRESFIWCVRGDAGVANVEAAAREVEP